MAVHNSIFQGFEWSQAFDLPEGTLEPGDSLRAELRRNAADPAPLVTLETGSGIAIEGNRIFMSLSELQTKPMRAGYGVKTNFVIVRGADEIPIGNVITIPVELLPTRPLP